MIKKIQLLLILTITISGFSQTTAIPDANFEQALIDLGIDSNGLTGDILNSDAAVATNIFLFNSNISDLTGIEAFVNLEVLEAGGNLLTSVDLSNNLLLRELDFFSNQLTSLDVTNNILLEDLTLDFNQITGTIDLSQNIELTRFFCQSNPNFSSLILTNNTKLRTLIVSDCNLGAIDLTTNTLLESVNLRGNSPLSSIDVTNQPGLINLKISSTNIAAVDISTNLILEVFHIAYTQVSSINTTNNPNLVYLTVEGSPISDLDLSQNTNLNQLIFSFTNITTIDLTQNINLINIAFMFCSNLITVDIKNGANTTINQLFSFNNPNLTCIIVDDINGAYLDSWTVDSDPSVFKEDNAACSAVLGIEDFNYLNEVSLYPNPSKDFINISGISTKNSSYKIYSILGKQVTKGTIVVDQNINIQNLKNGVYLVLIDDSKILKFVKE